jgi:hypothetical protein
MQAIFWGWWRKRRVFWMVFCGEFVVIWWCVVVVWLVFLQLLKFVTF